MICQIKKKLQKEIDGFEVFCKDDKTIDATVFAISQIGEYEINK